MVFCINPSVKSHFLDPQSCKSTVTINHHLNTATQMLMSNKHHFQLSGFINRQNCRHWMTENSCQMCKRPIHSTKVIVWCAVYFLTDKRDQNSTALKTFTWNAPCMALQHIPDDSVATAQWINIWHQENMLGCVMWTVSKPTNLLLLWYRLATLIVWLPPDWMS